MQTAAVCTTHVFDPAVRDIVQHNAIVAVDRQVVGVGACGGVCR